MKNECKRVVDRNFLVGEIKEVQLRLQEADAQLYELSLQRLGWMDCLNGLQELLKRCQAEDAKQAEQEKQKDKKVEK